MEVLHGAWDEALGDYHGGSGGDGGGGAVVVGSWPYGMDGG